MPTLTQTLIDAWIDEYYDMVSHDPYVLDVPDRGFNKGHLMAHSMGGSLDINVFPQRPEVNRGRSPEGRRYRAMERYAARHPGTFVFSRLIYGDDSWVPHALEYGILMDGPRFWVERFPN